MTIGRIKRCTGPFFGLQDLGRDRWQLSLTSWSVLPEDEMVTRLNLTEFVDALMAVNITKHFMMISSA